MPWPPHYLAIVPTGPNRVVCPRCFRKVSADMLYDMSGVPAAEYPFKWACDACLSLALRDGHVDWTEMYNRWNAPQAIKDRIAAKIAGGQIRARRTPSAPIGGVGLGKPEIDPARGRPQDEHGRPDLPTDRPLDDAGMPT